LALGGLDETIGETDYSGIETYFWVKGVGHRCGETFPSFDEALLAAKELADPDPIYGISGTTVEIIKVVEPGDHQKVVWGSDWLRPKRPRGQPAP
jgi:hypothetical protein